MGHEGVSYHDDLIQSGRQEHRAEHRGRTLEHGQNLSLHGIQAEGDKWVGQ